MTQSTSRSPTDTGAGFAASPSGGGATSTASGDDSHVLGTGGPSEDARPVGPDDRAAIAVFDDIDAAQQAVERLIAGGFPADQISIVGKDLRSEVRVTGFVTTGDIAGPSAATGAWVGGLFGVLAGTALLFVPGAGPVVVLGPLVAGAVAAAQGALVGGAIGAILGHFVAKEHLPKYESLVRAGRHLVVVQGSDENVARAQQLLADAGSADVQRHDDHRGSIHKRGPIEKVREGMRVVDADGKDVGKVTFVKLGDPGAVTTQGQDTGLNEPRLPRPFAERLLRVGFLKVDRKGLFASDAYVAPNEIQRVDGESVHLSAPQDMLLKETS